jgi:hypothetical protein
MTVLGDKGEVGFDGPGAALLHVADRLRRAGVPRCAEFAEMILTDMSADPARVCPSAAAMELVVAPMTDGEATAARVLREAMAYVAEVNLSDESLTRLVAVLTVYVARFDTYLAEREATTTAPA